MEKTKTRKVPWYGYVTLVLIILFLSGIFKNSEGPLKMLDFSNVLGKFGVPGILEDGTGKLARDFTGIGGNGVKQGFMLTLSITPGIILAFAIIELFTAYQGEAAAGVVFSPILRFLLGLPGEAIIPLVASLTTTDGAAAAAKKLVDDGKIDGKQNAVLNSFMFPSPAPLVNIFSVGAPIIAVIPEAKPVWMLALVILSMKLVAALLARGLAKFIK